MNNLLWILQGLGALLYGASGVMKVFLFDKVSVDVPSFGALPKKLWMALGVLELLRTAGLVLPVLHGPVVATVVAAGVLAAESLVFIWVHVKYREIPPIIMSATLGALMGLLAYGRTMMPI